MRTRAYRPEVLDCLEDRSLLSGLAGLSAHPVVLTHRRFNFVVERLRQGFDLFGRYRDIIQLRDEIDDLVVLIPFERVDGLGVSIDRIVNRMRRDLSAHVPHAVRSALNDVIAATRADVASRVRSGDVVLRG
jgi:hypothetical protein